MKDNGTVSMRDRLIQSAQIVVFGLLALALAVLMALELIPAQTKGLYVEDRLEVASFPVDSTGLRFVSSLHGSFKNDSNETVEVEEICVLLSNGKIRREIELESFTLPARCGQELELTFDCDVDVNTVVRIEAKVNGEDVVLENVGAKQSFSGAAIFYLVLLIPSVLLCIRAAKVRYYLYQESRLFDEKM